MSEVAETGAYEGVGDPMGVAGMEAEEYYVAAGSDGVSSA